MKYARFLVLLILTGFIFAALLSGQRKKKDEEEITQTLELLPDPPAALKADTTRLSFHVSPLSTKGLLSQQVRDGIKNLWRQTKRAQIVKIRAMVAGTGDMRRVQSIVSEMFSQKRQPLPVLSVVQVGMLPREGAQVVLEAIAVQRKPQNPHGLAFFSGQADSAPLDRQSTTVKVAPLTEKALADLRVAMRGAQVEAKDVLRVTCFATSLDDFFDVHAMVTGEYPTAAVNIVQVQRAPSRALIECESVARLRQHPGAPLKVLNVPGLQNSPNFSHVALVGSPMLILTGSQLGFRYQDEDVRLAFERLKSSLEGAGGSIAKVAMSSIYPLTPHIQQKISTIRFEFYDRAQPPASTMLLFEGLPSLDASFAVDVVGVPAEPQPSS
jgi:enamine deaminase RidA (YjgF/YER057c/UK114 family)